MKLKSVVLLIFCMVLTTQIFSQQYAADKGAMWIAGTGSFTSSGGDLFEDMDENRATCISFTPAVNYFVIPNVFVGGAIELSTDSQGDYKDTGFGVGPHAGYVFANESSTALPYVDAGFRYYSTKYEGGSWDSKTTGSDIFIGAGVVLPVAGHVGVVIDAGYHMMSLKHEDADESHSGNIISLGIGITGLLYNPD